MSARKNQPDTVEGPTAQELPGFNEMIQYFEYPGQPLVLAACILLAFPSIEDAARTTPRGHSSAEASILVPGAGGQPSKALVVLLRFKQDRDVDEAIRTLHADWRRSVSPSNFPQAFEPGQKKAERLEPVLRAVLERLAKEWQ